MKRVFVSVLIAVTLFTCLFFFSGCNPDTPDTDTEIQSEADISYMAEAQGICVMSACRMKPEEEGSSLSGNDDTAGIVVCNNSDKTLQYAEITATFSDGTAHLYKISTLPPGEVCFVAEEYSSPYRELSTGFFGFEIRNVAFFLEEPSVYSDRLQFSGTDGILNVKNISEADIAEDIIIYYKDYTDSHLASGRTYRITVKGGLRSGEIKQISANHYKQNGSMIMMVQFVSSEVAQ